MRQNNPEEVAKYATSVLKRESKEGDALKGICTEDLRQFLKDKTVPFVDQLFVTLKGECNFAQRKLGVVINIFCGQMRAIG